MPNRLIDATSPYLLQHADNPVDWFPWGEDALELALSTDRPILLSVGYSACHWCHVMAHESFENPEVAGIMNRHFVCVKVDREERPDLDAIYMDAVQTMSGHGGWPMTVFLTPEGEPFYAGTYFPPQDRGQIPGFARLLRAIADVWERQPADARAQGRRLTALLGRSSQLPKSNQPLTTELLTEATTAIADAHDSLWGGFGSAPKFPQPMLLEYLLGRHLAGVPGTLEMVTTSLDRMAAGGIYDQLGGGFHRYSTDRQWLVPHFEKMLYDNAQLARLYLHAWQVTGRPRYRDVALETAGYLLREMRGEAGGFYSAQDADSEGEEGRFFVWTYCDLVETAGEHGQAVATYLGVLPEGNWESPGEASNVLWTPHPLEQVSGETRVPFDELSAAVAAARLRLLAARSRRVRPATDDKVLAAWNGMAITALAEIGRALDRPDCLEAAAEAADFVLSRLRRPDGRLCRSWRAGRISGPAYLDDYALMAAACLSLHESTFELRWMEEARRLANGMLELFGDPGGGFFQTGADTETLIARPKELFDSAMPSGSSAAAEILLRLALLTGERTYEEAALGSLRLIRDLISRAPLALGHTLSVLALYLEPAGELAIVGDPGQPGTRALATETWRLYRPALVMAGGRPQDRRAAEVVALLAGRHLVDGRPAAYLCRRFACQQPVTEPADLAHLLTTMS